MIVITGPGRSGTSLLAQTYLACGIDPGGQWFDEVNAGLEDPEVVTLNTRMLERLNGSLVGLTMRDPLGRFPNVRRAVKAAVSKFPEAEYQRLRRLWRASVVERRDTEMRPVDWSNFEEVVESHRLQMCDIAKSKFVVKDPQFCLTLPMWIAAGADISHVLVTTRRVDGMLKSRMSAGLFGTRSASQARNALLLATGTLVATLWDSPEISATFLRFPEFVDDIESTASQLPLPPGVSRQDLRQALRSVARPDIIQR